MAVAVLVFFTWLTVEPWQYLPLVRSWGKKPVAQAAAPTASPEAQLAQLLKDLETQGRNLSDKVAAGQPATAEANWFGQAVSTLASLHGQMQGRFKEIEQQIAPLPAEIHLRHQQAVLKYEQNIPQVQQALQALTADATPSGKAAKAQALADLLQQINPQPQPIPLDPNNLPVRSPEATPIPPRLTPAEYALTEGVKLASADPQAVLLAQATTSPPTAADLAETIEVQFTPEIQAKAQELGHNPVKIYNWVRNTIEFVPTYGSIQGAQMCLLTKQCNAFDTASLLIALLRVSGIHARYEYGTIEVPIEKVMNWVGGFTNPQAALQILAQGGIPIKGIVEGGTLTKVQMEHVWVRAWIDYIPSRGAVHKQGDTWVSLDASFKQYTYSDPIDYITETGFDVNAFLNEIIAGSTIDPANSSVMNVPQALIGQRLQEYLQRVQQLIPMLQTKTFADVFGSKTVVRHEYPFLVGTHPYKVPVKGFVRPEVPDNLRHKIGFTLSSQILLWWDASYTGVIPALAGKRITIAYIPASSTDEALIRQYGAIVKVPPYLLQLKPQVMVEGVVVATGDTIGSGQELNFAMSFRTPSGVTDTVLNRITAGVYLAIGMDSQLIPKDFLEKRLARLETALGSPTTPIDEKVGETLYLHALMYFAVVGVNTAFTARLTKVAYLRLPAEAIVSETWKVTTIFEIPLKAIFGGLAIDVDRNLYAPVGKDGDKNRAFRFLVIAGFHSSAMEHALFEQLYNVGGISAVKVLQLANAQGIPIYRINKTNLSAVLPLLQVDLSIKQEIQNHVNAGNLIYVPEQNVQYFDWIGSAYIAMNPVTGAAGYIISGGFAGGWWALLLDCLESIVQFVDLLPLQLFIKNPWTLIIMELLAANAALHDINQKLDEKKIDEATANQAKFYAMMSLIVGVWGIVAQPQPFASVVSSIFEVFFYIELAILLEGGLPFWDFFPFADCSAL